MKKQQRQQRAASAGNIPSKTSAFKRLSMKLAIITRGNSFTSEQPRKEATSPANKHLIITPITSPLFLNFKRTISKRFSRRESKENAEEQLANFHENQQETVMQDDKEERQLSFKEILEEGISSDDIRDPSKLTSSKERRRRVMSKESNSLSSRSLNAQVSRDSEPSSNRPVSARLSKESNSLSNRSLSGRLSKDSNALSSINNGRIFLRSQSTSCLDESILPVIVKGYLDVSKLASLSRESILSSELLTPELKKLILIISDKKQRSELIQSLLPIPGNHTVKVRFIWAIQECLQETNLKLQENKFRNILQTFLEQGSLFQLKFPDV